MRIVYWEKWTKFEGQAARDMVDAFNRKYEGRIHVEIRTLAKIEEKLLLAIAYGTPPDVAGIHAFNVPDYAARRATICLDDYLVKDGISRRDFLAPFWDLCEYQGKMWALPTRPITLALHWNKRLFRKAGLDPEKPPRTLAELDAFAEKLTKRDPVTGELVQMGFLPEEPGWWPWAWGVWFGAKLCGRHRRTPALCPENVRALEWVASYSKKYGVDDIRRLAGGFGYFSSRQNPFLSGKVAMILQGVWMHNFIDHYVKGMEWGAAPFPSAVKGAAPTTIADADIIVIPRGSRHPREAWEFIKFVNSPEGAEILALGMRGFSPLRKVSPGFWAKHPHPYIKLFCELADSPNAVLLPRFRAFPQYRDEMVKAFDRVRTLQATPEEALADVERRLQGGLGRQPAKSRH